jgi:hypothetical protein
LPEKPAGARWSQFARTVVHSLVHSPSGQFWAVSHGSVTPRLDCAIPCVVLSGNTLFRRAFGGLARCERKINTASGRSFLEISDRRENERRIIGAVGTPKKLAGDEKSERRKNKN